MSNIDGSVRFIQTCVVTNFHGLSSVGIIRPSLSRQSDARSVFLGQYQYLHHQNCETTRSLGVLRVYIPLYSLLLSILMKNFSLQLVRTDVFAYGLSAQEAHRSFRLSACFSSRSMIQSGPSRLFRRKKGVWRCGPHRGQRSTSINWVKGWKEIHRRCSTDHNSHLIARTYALLLHDQPIE